MLARPHPLEGSGRAATRILVCEKLRAQAREVGWSINVVPAREFKQAKREMRGVARSLFKGARRAPFYPLEEARLVAAQGREIVTAVVRRAERNVRRAAR